MRLRVGELAVDADGDRARLSARLVAPALGWRGLPLWFDVPRALTSPEPRADAFAVALLLPAMASALDLHVEAPLSASLLDNLARAQSLLAGWNRRNPWARLRRVALTTDGTADPAPGLDATGLFFTAGVDSLHSLLHARDMRGAVDLLLYVEGFDVPLDAPALARSVRARLRAAAADARVPLAVARTNLREVIDPIVSWEMSHGAALAAVGHVLAPAARRWVISSADAYISGAVYGTAEALDPLWSREGLAFATGGAGLDRLHKLQRLAGEPLARRHLVVCWQDRPAAGNCGRCAKCVRTALQLQVLGALDGFDTLPHRVDPAAVDAILAEPAHRVFIWRDVLARLRERSEWAPLASSVEALIERSLRAGRPPTAADLATRDGRRLAAEWLRRQVKPRLPVAVRRRLLTVVRRAR